MKKLGSIRRKYIYLGAGGIVTLCLLCLAIGSFADETPAETVEAIAMQVERSNSAILENTATEAPTETIIPSSTATETPIPTNTVEPTSTEIPLATLPGGYFAKCVPLENARQIGQVVRVIDGDTIEVKIDGESYAVRYIGMDTPESGQPLGDKALERNQALVNGHEIILVIDTSEVDQHDRLLRYVFIQDVFVNYQLVQEGLAQAVSYPPDTACDANFNLAMAGAKTAHVGLWIPTATYKPAVVVQPTRPPATQPVSSGATTGGGSTAKNCDPSYPDVCIKPPPPDLDCGDIPYRRFRVVGSDPHRFDGDHDGIGCES